MWMESMHGAHARVANNVKKERLSVFMSVLLTTMKTRAMEGPMPPVGGARGQKQPIDRRERRVRREHRLRSNVRLDPPQRERAPASARTCTV